jgi:hypothetical protein
MAENNDEVGLYILFFGYNNKQPNPGVRPPLGAIRQRQSGFSGCGRATALTRFSGRGPGVGD